MDIKRYMVTNMQEALHQIKKDLGPDAIIVSSHKVREKGLKGLFSPLKIEVTAVAEKNEAEIVKEELGQIKSLLTHVSQKNLSGYGNYSMSTPEQDILNKIKQCFLRMEVDEQIVDSLLRDLDVINKTQDEIKEQLQERVAALFKPATADNDGSKVLAFIGTPGVGKTTTLAKIGAIYSLFNSFSIAFITIDTYRIGAVEQMRIYGDIIGATVEVVTSPAELRLAVEKHKDKDLILIDTAGRPSRNLYQLAEVKSFLEGLDFVDIHLVISAATKNNDMLRILNDYKVIAYSKLIITKTDETELLGSLLNVAHAATVPIAYITNGQAVPDDIEPANPKLLAGWIMKDVVF